MISDELVNSLENGLNALSDLEFKIFTNLGDYQDAIRQGNQEIRYINGCARVLPTTLLPIPNVNMFTLNIELEFAVNVEEQAKDDNGNYILPLEVANVLQQYCESNQAIPYIQEIDETNYQIIPLFTLPSISDNVYMASSDTGEVLPIRMSIEFVVTENIVNANSYTLQINGENINFETLTFTKTRTANAYTFKGNSNTKTEIIQGAVGIDVVMPQFLQSGSDLVVNDIVSDTNNTLYSVVIGYPLSTGLQTKKYIMTSGNGTITAQKTSNVGLNFSLVEANVLSFADSSWEEIQSISETGIANEIYSVGDTKEITLSDGTTATLFILGFNHDVDTNGNTVGITIGLQGTLPNKYKINDEQTNIGGYVNSVFNQNINNIINMLPNDLQAVLKTVVKKCDTGNTENYIIDFNSKLFLLAEEEIYGSARNSFAGQGTQYDYYKNNGVTQQNNTQFCVKNNNLEDYWWLRNCDKSTDNCFGLVVEGISNVARADTEQYISFAFCV